MKNLVVLTLSTLFFISMSFLCPCFGAEPILFSSESKAFTVMAVGKVKLNRLRDDSRLIHEYVWSNQLNTEFVLVEGIELKKDQNLEQFVDSYLKKIHRPNYIVVKEAKSRGNGWFGQKLFFYSDSTKKLEQETLVAMSVKEDLVYVLTARALSSEQMMDKVLTKQFFDSFELHPEAASAEQNSKDMNSLGYSVGPLILALFLFGFVFTIFFVLGVILYRMRQS